MQKRSEQIWKTYLTIKGGDFSDWYEGLSPIENHLFNRQLRLK